MAKTDFDVVVIGGGPAGATAATVSAMDGHRVLLLEKEYFPRYHIGESLLPSTVQGICRFLGVGNQLARAGFVKKHGATFRWGEAEDLWSVGFVEAGAVRDENRIHAYQVERSRFDEILLRNAEAKGALVEEGRRVSGVRVGHDHRIFVRYSDGGVANGRTSSVSCRYVVDASGANGLLSGRVGRRQYDPFFRNVAIFAYYRGAARLRGELRGNVLSAAFAKGWFWFIPLSHDVTSVGVVAGRDALSTVRRLGPAKSLRSFIDECGPIRSLLSGAKRIRHGELGLVRVVRDYSYSNTRLWMPGVVLIGDAAMFVDPLFSSGVHLATYSGLLAARSVNTSLNGELGEARSFREFERRYRSEFRLFYQFLVAFYEFHADPESYFWMARKILSGAGGSSREVFVRLISGMAQAAGERQTSPQNILETLRDATERLREVQWGKDERATPLVMQRARARLELAELGQVCRPKRHRHTKLQGGLRPSVDGLRWRR